MPIQKALPQSIIFYQTQDNSGLKTHILCIHNPMLQTVPEKRAFRSMKTITIIILRRLICSISELSIMRNNCFIPAHWLFRTNLWICVAMLNSFVSLLLHLSVIIIWNFLSQILMSLLKHCNEVVLSLRRRIHSSVTILMT